MALTNEDNAFGLRAIGKVGQNRDNQGLSEYGIAASSTAIYQNDPIMMAATGKIVVGTAAAVLLGSLNGVFYTDATNQKPTWANHLAVSIIQSATVANGLTIFCFIQEHISSPFYKLTGAALRSNN